MLQVERILGRRWNTRSRRIEFLTVWKGFEDDPSEYTWEPESNFSVRSLAIFKQMWGKANDPPRDGKEEMLNERDIKKLRELESKSTNYRGANAASSTHVSTEANSSSPSSSVRRSTRARTTASDPTESGGKVGKKDEADFAWTPVNECILLLTALEHPEDLVSEGPGEFCFSGFCANLQPHYLHRQSYRFLLLHQKYLCRSFYRSLLCVIHQINTQDSGW